MFYDVFMTRYISMPMSLNGTEHMYIVTASAYNVLYGAELNCAYIHVFSEGLEMFVYLHN
jgi:hypothetical protein